MTQSQILIVEDEGIVAMELQNRLRTMGYGVAGIASTGATAIEKATRLHPHLILMDIKLKGDIDGVAAAEQIRAHFDIPVIYLTAFADEHTLQRAKVTGPYGYLLKPFEERELYIAIEMALYKHSLETKAKTDQPWLPHSLDTISDAIIATDAQGQINFMNQAAAQLTGWSQAEALGQAITEIFQVIHEKTGAPLENPITKALRDGLLEDPESETLLIDKAGVSWPIDKHAAPIRDKNGQIMEVVLIFRTMQAQTQPATLFL